MRHYILFFGISLISYSTIVGMQGSPNKGQIVQTILGTEIKRECLTPEQEKKLDNENNTLDAGIAPIVLSLSSSLSMRSLKGHDVSAVTQEGLFEKMAQEIRKQDNTISRPIASLPINQKVTGLTKVSTCSSNNAHESVKLDQAHASSVQESEGIVITPHNGINGFRLEAYCDNDHPYHQVCSTDIVQILRDQLGRRRINFDAVQELLDCIQKNDDHGKEIDPAEITLLCSVQNKMISHDFDFNILDDECIVGLDSAYKKYKMGWPNTVNFTCQSPQSVAQNQLMLIDNPIAITRAKVARSCDQEIVAISKMTSEDFQDLYGIVDLKSAQQMRRNLINFYTTIRSMIFNPKPGDFEILSQKEKLFFDDLAEETQAQISLCLGNTQNNDDNPH